jgi:predicted MPP superfamily phosphohydrolase
VNRRAFFRTSLAFAAAGPAATVGYGLWEAQALRVTRQSIAVPRLPAAFSGITVALLADPHHGPFNGLSFIQSAVDRVNALKPDLIALAGDYVQQSASGVRYIEPCLEALGRLRAPLGVFAVPGNHDHWGGAVATRRAMRKYGLEDVTNSGVWIERDYVRLRIGGVDDLWNGKQNLSAALGDCGPDETALLLSHNPDYAETIADPRVGLVLSGHMHGGQMRVPGLDVCRIPSRYGLKYLRGLVRAPHTQVFVSTGLGCVTLPLRIGARPEVNLLTLVPG